MDERVSEPCDDPRRWAMFCVLLVGAFLLLGSMGLPVLHMQVGPSDSKSLPASAESRRVQDALNGALPPETVRALIADLIRNHPLTRTPSPEAAAPNGPSPNQRAH